MDNKSVIIIILTILVVIGIFAGAFYIIGSNDKEAKTVVANDTSDVSDVSDDNVSEIKNATLSAGSNEPKQYEDWQKDYETGMYDEDGNPIYRSVMSTSGGQNDPGIYESYWSANGPINQTRIG